MRYWHPFTESAIADMKADGIDQIVVLPFIHIFQLAQVVQASGIKKITRF